MELEIKVMWCKGLNAFNFFQKLTIYTSVSITCEDQRLKLTQHQKQEQKTPVDEEGGGDPEWNHTMKFDLRSLKFINPNLEDLSLRFEFRHHGQLFGDKIIGQVCVPLKSLIDSVGFEVVRFVSYEVRNPEGKHNGIFDFSYKVVGDLESQSSYVTPDVQITGFHPHHRPHHSHSYGNATTDDNIMMGYHNNHSASEPGRIEYPKIDFDGWDADNNTSNHNASSSSSAAAMITNHVHYPPPPAYPPHMWGPPPPPPPQTQYRQQAAVYPPQPGHGDPYWGGYHRPPEYDQYHPW